MGISSNFILSVVANKPEIRDRFWTKVQGAFDDLTACWPWQAAFSRCGYGNFFLTRGDDGKGVYVQSHRMSFILARGFLCEHKKLLHECDNPVCCNPYHGEPGTHADNMKDAYAKGRLIPGKTKVPPEAYAEICRLKAEGVMGNRELAKAYDCNPRTIGRIVNGEMGNVGYTDQAA